MNKAVFFLSISLLFMPSVSGSTSLPNTSLDSDLLKRAHLIIEGTIVDIRYETLTFADLGVEPREFFELIPVNVAIVEVVILDHIKGPEVQHIVPRTHNAEVSAVHSRTRLKHPIRLRLAFSLLHGSDDLNWK